jgi:3-keto-5-aminohexanoate cleavage enzyme
MASDQPVIIEVAINGTTSKARNPHAPREPAEVAEVALQCIAAGATIVHSHNDDIRLSGREAADRYAAGLAPVHAARPDAILYPTVAFAEGEDRFAHFRDLAAAGIIEMGVLDPGSTNFATLDDDGLPGKDMVYANSYTDIRHVFALLSELGLGASMALYEPSFARAVLAYHRAGKLPKGSFTKFYFGGAYDFLTGEPGGPSFGFPPTEKALDAYVEMFEGTGLPWATAVLGGDLVATGMARWTLERGGHLRVGLEDYAGPDTPSNVELIEAAKALCAEVGRPIATAVQTRDILSMN